jgi:hypothetical protein
LSVIAYFITGVGWVILVRLLSIRRGPPSPGPFDWARWLEETVMSLSPVFGPMGPVGVLLNFEQYSRLPSWIATGVVLLIKAAVAALLLWLSIKTFDRCLGRVPERRSPDPVVPSQPGSALRLRHLYDLRPVGARD